MKNATKISLVVGNFDTMNGIRIIDSWNNSEEFLNEEEKTHILKTVLTGMHRLDEDFFQAFPISFVDFPTIQCLSINSFFMHKSYFSISVIIQTNTYFNPSCSLLTSITRNLCDELMISVNLKPNLEKLLPHSLCERVFFDIDMFIQSPSSPPISTIFAFHNNISIPFLSKILCAHLSTQMTTVLRATNPDQALDFSSFLSHFSLPFQIKQSRFDLKDYLTPDLYIQCCT